MADAALTLGALVGHEVLSSDAVRLGEVIDVRAGATGRVPAGGPELLIEGVIVGRRRLGARLGYDRTEFQGPLLLHGLLRLFHHSSRLVPWAEVEAVDESGRVKVRLTFDDFSALDPDDVVYRR